MSTSNFCSVPVHGLLNMTPRVAAAVRALNLIAEFLTEPATKV
jgi:hypothetical protein